MSALQAPASEFLAELARADVLEHGLAFARLHVGKVLYEPAGPIDYVYFPLGGLVSRLLEMRNGRAIVTDVIGQGGLIGASIVGDGNAFDQAVVHIPGIAQRLPSSIFLAAYEQSQRFRQLVNQYNAIGLKRAQQAAACNAVHSAQARLARWLLLARDRTGSDKLPLTQEVVSRMVGVQRTSVTLMEGELQDSGLIALQRGLVTIINPEGLQLRACECYAAVRESALPDRAEAQLAHA